MAELDRTKVTEIVRKEIKKNSNPLEIIEWLSKGLNIVGDYFEKNEYYLAELLTGADIFETVFQEIIPILEKKNITSHIKGKVIIGTVKGDIHDIGKNIIKTFLTVSGFYVEDLGVDVSPEKFVEAIKLIDAKIVALSALLTVAIDSVSEIIRLLEEEKLRGKVKIIIGGSAFTEEIAKSLGVDAYGKNPMEALKNCMKFLQ